MSETLRQAIAAQGFDVVRFAAAAAAPTSTLREWLGAGHHADMAWMERTAEKRLDLQQVLPGAQSVIVLGVNYWGGADPAPGRPRWARYSRYEDYHDTVKPGLVAAGRQLETICGIGPADYRYYTDTGPVLERGWSARGGIGFTGKNTMLISREFGNWLLLSAIVTRAALPADPPQPGSGHRLCGKCTRCLEACPTAAFAGPGRLDARRCISYQTIENRGVIPRELRAGIGDRVFGCDVCLEVCPWNRFAQAGRATLMQAREAGAALSWRELLELTPERFAAIFKGTAVKRLKLIGLLRNACIGAGNSGDVALIVPLLNLTGHPHPLVRAHAVWAVQCLAGEAAVALLAAARSRETDPAVLEEYVAPVPGATARTPPPAFPPPTQAVEWAGSPGQ